MIEGAYARASRSHVFESLSEIQRAQVESLGLLRPGGSPFRFAFAAKQRHTLAKSRAVTARLFQALSASN